MDEKRKIDFVIKATDEASGTLGTVEDRIKRLQKQAQASGGNVSGGGFFPGISGLKEVLGGRGTLKDISEIAMGGGAIVGLSFTGDAIKRMAEGIIQFRDGMHAANADAGALTEKLLGSLPIFGSFFQAGRAIRELATGEAEATARITEEAKRTNEYLDVRLNLLKEQKATLDVMHDIVGPLFGKIETTGLKDPLLTATKTRQEFQAQSDALDKIQADGVAKSRAAAKAEIDKLRAEISSTNVPQRLGDIIPGADGGKFDQPNEDARASLAQKNSRLRQLQDQLQLDEIVADNEKVNAVLAGGALDLAQNSAKLRDVLLASGKGIAAAGKSFFGNLFTGSKNAAAGPLGGAIGLFEGLAGRTTGPLPRLIPHLAGLSESSTLSGFGSRARDNLLGIQSERERKNAEILQKQAQEATAIKLSVIEILGYFRRFGSPGSNVGSSLLNIFGKR